jgi:lysyl-tRNA synthetase class 1
MNMSSRLLDGLEKLGIEYTFKRARDTYKEGLLQEQIHTILTQSERIGAKIEDLVGQEKYQKFLPYFPVCAQCNRLYVAEATEYLSDERKVRYKCHDAEIGGKIIKGCGHEGEADIKKDLGKLAWKVEFAARWSAFDIRFEAYGKDIMDSVKVNDWVADDVLNFPHPHHIKYEMFLDKGGKKISKSLGNVVTSQTWLKFGTPESILLLLYKRITGARELGFEDIPSLMDEYNELEKIFFGKIKIDNEAKLVKSKGLYEYVNLLTPPKQIPAQVSYRLLLELCKIFKEDRVPRINKKLIDYHAIKETSAEIDKLIEMAGNFADEFDISDEIDIDVDSKVKGALSKLVILLEKDEEIEDLQNEIYQIAKGDDIEPKDFFKVLYQIILSTTRGPKIGPFILDIGKKNVAEKIGKYVN